MKRISAILLALGAVLAAGGWIFQTRREPPTPDYSAVFTGDTRVTVRIESGDALSAAARAADDFRSDGWDELPVSTATFKIFARGRHSAAFLAEDLPQGGSRISEYRH